MQVVLFKYEYDDMLNDIRTIEIDGEIWFVGADVARILGYAKPNNAISTHCKERGTLKQGIPTSSGVQNMTLINEANVYRLIIKSQLPTAERFETWLFEEVVPSIRKKGYYGNIDRLQLPNFIARYKDNYHKLPNDHFSVISEMFARMYMELEKVGYSIPDKAQDGKNLVPDISVGKGFAKYLKDGNSKFYDSHKKYMHTYPDGREYEANMYHIDVLPDFIKYLNNVWFPEYAFNYFQKRDPLALEYLPKVIEAHEQNRLVENK